MIRCVRFVFVWTGLLSLFGCSNAVSVISTEENVQFIERNAGVVGEPSLDYDFLIGGTEVKQIVSVSADCGCTQLSLRKGECLDFSKPFPINIQLNINYFGKGHQDFFIQFADGTALKGRLAYEYAPPPFVTPKELLFFEDVSKKELVFSFPNESGVTIQEVVTPAGITWKHEPNGGKKNEVCLVFEINRSLFVGEQTGKIEVVTTSRKKPRFPLPYLVLHP